MTRDEAIELAHEKWVKPNTKSSECIVDILSALGILKLDEPKTYNIYGLLVPMKAVMTLNDSGWDLRLFKVLAEAGLRIVEK